MMLSVVIPVFNEQETIPELHRRLEQLRNKLSGDPALEIIYVDDGSSDASGALLNALADQHKHVKLVTFSRNFGHQIAITAGIDFAKGDFVAVIDGDLQDPPELIEDMLRLAGEGYDVVFGKRRVRRGDSWFKRFTAKLFYRLLSYLCDIEIPVDTGDFRLMSRRAVEALKSMRERHRFVRGMVPWVGYRSVSLDYDRDQRYAGETKYPLSKMVGFAANAILSFSRKPLKLATRLGFAIVTLGVVGAIYMLYLKVFTNIPVAGLTAVLVTIVIFGGVQILLIGLVGEYVARIFEEVKERPLYIIAGTKNFEHVSEIGEQGRRALHRNSDFGGGML